MDDARGRTHSNQPDFLSHNLYIDPSIPTEKEAREVVEVEAEFPCEANREGMLGGDHDHVALWRQSTTA
jgi:hypothetical protein